MACNTKPGPSAAIEVIEFATDTKVSQKDWHTLRQWADEAGLNTKRGTADSSQAAEAFDALVTRLGADLPEGYDSYMAKTAKKARKRFTSVDNSHGTVAVLTLLASEGPEDTLSRLRHVAVGNWEPEVSFLATLDEGDLAARLAHAEDVEARLKANERDFGYLDTARLARTQARIDALRDALSRKTAHTPRPGRHTS